MFKVTVKKKGKDPLKNMKAIKRATAFTLNDMAERDSKKSSDILKRDLTVRTPKFFEPAKTNKKTTSGFKLRTARVSASIKRQFSEAGSVKRPRFTGWRENQYGTKQNRSSISTSFARGNNQKKVVKRSLRLDKMNNAPKDSDFGSGQTGSTIMLRKLQRENYKGVFIVTNHNKMRKGAYKFTGRARKGKLKNVSMVKKFDVDYKRTKRNRWKQKAHKANTHMSVRAEYRKQYKRAMKRS